MMILADKNVETVCSVSDKQSEIVLATSRKIIRVNNHNLPKEPGCAIVNIRVDINGRISTYSYIKGTYDNIQKFNLPKTFFFKKSRKSWEGIIVFKVIS
jgi:hypothetical protein